ncbi:hypothetical protein Leryth_005793 [Lithospermum erythrorhizon]|nr:hypothetical protein Leryth_005793 [Lithospermum erythrorhizon]
MNRKMSDSSQAEINNQVPASPSGSVEHQDSSHGNKVLKSGSLFLSSRGIGWTSWKKRWFILTRTSLVFFRSDPNAVLPNGSEVNCTLGGIDLNSSGSVVVKEDKKLITVQFADGRDGRTFTLKAETSEDLLEWKVALEEALANAPSASLSMGQNGILNHDQGNAADIAVDQSKDRQPVKSMVIGRPVLLALEDIDGTPSFLEKALRFVEEEGVKVEGILRQAADVEDVERRIREYEQGKTEFSSEEDAHVIADCVKYVLRELPSSPVPASCCNALLEACRTERNTRFSAMRNAICETFPEPNRRLLQRILTMMQTIAAHKDQNRMSVSAVAACMAPLLLRPLLSGECELQQKFDADSDSSAQLMQAAAAANHAQSICITLLEEYDDIFGVGTEMPELYSDSEYSGSESEELTEDDETTDGGSDYDSTDGSGTEGDDDDDDDEHSSSGASSEADGTEEVDKCSGSSRASSRVSLANAPKPTVISNDMDKDSDGNKDRCDAIKVHDDDYDDQLLADLPSSSKSPNLLKGIAQSARRPALWGRTGGRKNLSMESIDLPFEEESDIQRLMATKVQLQNRIAEEAHGNEKLLGRLEKRKNSLHERRKILQKDVARLKEQLNKERELRRALESGLTSRGQVPDSDLLDEKTIETFEDIAEAEVDVENLKQKADDLGAQLDTHRDHNSRLRQMKVEPKDVDSAAARSKGTDSTSSAHSNLTTRLNLMKERRSQRTYEPHNVGKGGSSGQSVRTLQRGKGSESGYRVQRVGKSEEPEEQSSD